MKYSNHTLLAREGLHQTDCFSNLDVGVHVDDRYRVGMSPMQQFHSSMVNFHASQAAYPLISHYSYYKSPTLVLREITHFCFPLLVSGNQRFLGSVFCLMPVTVEQASSVYRFFDDSSIKGGVLRVVTRLQCPCPGQDQLIRDFLVERISPRSAADQVSTRRRELAGRVFASSYNV